LYRSTAGFLRISQHSPTELRPFRGGKTYDFDCDAIIFTGLEMVIMMLAYIGLRLNEGKNLLENVCKLKASRFPNTSGCSAVAIEYNL
jgi:thiazole synthase ThiGH ThiG subunit